jgi:hypothetical protein
VTNELIPIRLSRLLGLYGVGAIVRGKNGLVVVQDIRQWTDRQGLPAGKLIPYVERVRAVLQIEEQLHEPPVAKELANEQFSACVPATRFPSWMNCPARLCGVMYRWPWKKDQPDHAPRCNQQDCTSHPELKQLTWVLVDHFGHLGDVPYWHLAHRGVRNPAQRNCKVKDQLRLIERGYEKHIRCDACNAKAKFRGDERVGFGKGRMQPWTKDDMVPPIEDGEEDEENRPQVLGINDTRVYQPVAESVLVIPPESRVRKGTPVDRLYRTSEDRLRIDKAKTPLARKSIIQMLASEYRCKRNDIEEALDDLDRGYPLYGENPTSGQVQESEFEAFLEVLPDQREDEDLVTRNRSDEWRELRMAVDLNTDLQRIVCGVRHLVRVDRLKAVKVFKGFGRLGGEERDPREIVPADIVGESHWLPAIELYGEGIFLTLDEEQLKEWEQTPAVVSRLDSLRPRFAQSGHDDPNPLTTRFMLLHTLSHLLMRQIESEGGYPAASLNERLYCNKTTKIPMAGILIYVAVPDIHGSLGGLAELSEPRRFLGILTRALEHSRWCSLDPVCSEHEGQGPGLLNRAACHACVLVPDPACEYRNTLLDRGFVKSDAESGLSSFFGVT